MAVHDAFRNARCAGCIDKFNDIVGFDCGIERESVSRQSRDVVKGKSGHRKCFAVNNSIVHKKPGFRFTENVQSQFRRKSKIYRNKRDAT